jgi:thioredoxin 1
MKKTIFLVLIIALIPHNIYPEGKGEKATDKVVSHTNEDFKNKIFNYEVNKEWKYTGKLPAIIDFYADWCGPCRRMSPIIEEIADEFDGKIIVYKVNTDMEQMLSRAIGITSLPTLVFIPAHGQPQVSIGAISKETLLNAISEVLLIKK